jgi:hypothetical protein
MKKKLLAVLFTVMMLTMVACGGNNKNDNEVIVPTTERSLSADWNVKEVKDTSKIKLPKDWTLEEKDNYFTIKSTDGKLLFVGFDASKYTGKKNKVKFEADDIKISYKDKTSTITSEGHGYSSGAGWFMRKVTYNGEEAERYFLQYNTTVIIGIDTKDKVTDEIVDEIVKKIDRFKEEPKKDKKN